MERVITLFSCQNKFYFVFLTYILKWKGQKLRKMKMCVNTFSKKCIMPLHLSGIEPAAHDSEFNVLNTWTPTP